MSRFAFGIVLVFLCAGSVLADEIIFKNGDRISGTVTGADAGKVTINTALAGSLSVPMDQIRTFSTDAPITLKLRDGNIVTDRIARDADGHIGIGGTGTVKPQSVALIDIDKINPPPVKWTGSIAVGGIMTQGNSKTESFNANFDTVRRSDDDRITFDAGYFFANQKQRGSALRTTTTDNWFIAGKYDYFFSKKFYGYANAKVERDRIANLDIRFTPGAGVGYQWAESADFNFRTEAGLSWVYQNRNIPGIFNPAAPVGSQFTPGHQVSESHVAARVAYHVDKALNDKVRVYHDFEIFPDLENAEIFTCDADWGLRATIYKNMFSEIRVEWRYDENAPFTTPKTYKNDWRYVLNVGWTF